MNTNNDVFQVLVTSDDQSSIGAGAVVGDLSPGQIGIFEAYSSEAIVAPPAKNIFIAVGLDKDGDTITDAMNFSAGEHIQINRIKGYTFRPHTAAQPMIFELDGYQASCDTEYALKMEFRNQEIYRIQGHNQFQKTYVITTDCCEECIACPSGDSNEITVKMVEAINADEDGLATAIAITLSDLTIVTHGTSADYTAGDEITLADVEALIVFNAANAGSEVYTKIQVTTVPLTINTFCSINLKHFHPRQTIVIPSLVMGFGCSGTLTTTQEAIFEEGNGYDIQQKEYAAGGWNGKPGPYKVSELNGLPSEGFEYYADKTGSYDQIIITYDNESKSGWGTYYNPMTTIIAVPCEDTTTLAALIAVLDAFIVPLGFQGLTDDVAAADDNPANTEPTSGKTPETDGITSA